MSKIKTVLPLKPSQNLLVFSPRGSLVDGMLDSMMLCRPNQPEQEVKPVFVGDELVLVDEDGLLWAESECLVLPEDDYTDEQVAEFLEKAGIKKCVKSLLVVEPNCNFSLALVRRGRTFHLGYFKTHEDVKSYAAAMISGDHDFSLEAAGFDGEVYDPETDCLICVETNVLGMTRFHSI